MKIPAWSPKPLKEERSALIQLPTCKRRSLISEKPGCLLQPAARVLWYLPQTFIHLSSILATWYRRIYSASLQHGNLTLKDLPTPAPARGGVFVLFLLSVSSGHSSTLKQESWSFIRHHHHVATCVTRDATFPCQCFKMSDTHKKTKRDGRESLCGKISLPNVSRKRQKKQNKKKTWAHSQTQNTLLTLRICVHTSVRSHHIIFFFFFVGKKILLFVLWFIFVLFPPPDCSLVLPHLHAHTNTEIHTSTRVRHLDSGWPGTPITLSPSLKS